MYRFRTLAAASAVALSAGLAALAGTGAASAGTPPPPPTHTTLPPGPPPLTAPGSGTTQVRFYNWSGYADTGSTGKFYKVTNTFIQPKVTCNPNLTGGNGYEQVSIWNGIDGFSNGQVEQGGTDAWCYKGQGPFYDTWWEHYPVNNEQVVGTTVKAGDHIAVSTIRSGTKYTVKVTDSTTPGNSFTHSFSCAANTCLDTSAEFVIEAPGGDPGEPANIYPLVQFAPMRMTAAVVNTGHIKSFPNDEMTMVDVNNSSIVKAQPGALNLAGTAFSDTWKSAGP